MIATPITGNEAVALAYGNNEHKLGTIIRRLVFAGAKQSASDILDQLSEPLEQYMKTEPCWHMDYPDEIGRDWIDTRDTYYANRVF